MRRSVPIDTETGWIRRLRHFMEARGLNPRSLSLQAGLNATAVRDMLEGRVKYPRYDTVEALAQTLGLTPARLMSDAEELSLPGTAPGDPAVSPKPMSAKAQPAGSILDDDDLNLLTEIIARLQETAAEYRHRIDPQNFAAMVTSIYRQVKPPATTGAKAHGKNKDISPTVRQLVDYDRLLSKTGK